MHAQALLMLLQVEQLRGQLAEAQAAAAEARAQHAVTRWV